MKYPEQYIINVQYQEIGLRFTEFFETYIMPSDDRYLRNEGLPGLPLCKFRSTAANELEFKNFFELIRNNHVWVSMRLHELIHL